MRFTGTILIVVASAVLYGWAYPPNPHPALAWGALVPLLVILRRGTTGRALLLAWLWTVAMAYTVNDWFPRAVSGYFEQPALVGIALFFAVSTFTAGLQYIAFAWMYRRMASLHATIIPFVAAAAWVSADLGRLLMFGGDPWALLGYSQVGVLPLMQIADATGVHGITFVVAAVNAAIAEVLCGRHRGRRWLPAGAGLCLAIVAVAALWTYGTFRLSAGVARSSGHPSTVPVGIVQAHLPLGAQWRRELYGRNLEAYLRMTSDLLRSADPPRLIVWPENSMTFFLDREATYRRSISHVLEPFGAELIAGGPSAIGDPPTAYLNSAFLVSPDGDILGRYDKQLLLPFAEYFPLGGIDFLRRSFGRVRQFTPGERTPLLETAAGAAGVIICNEGFFPEPAAARVRDGATILVNLANDSWLADAKYSAPAFDMVTLRAVEQRRWIIRTSTAGPSALIDPFGRVMMRTNLMSNATIAGAVEPLDSITLYGRIGDTFAWLCVAVSGLASLAAGRRRTAKLEGGGESSDGDLSSSAAA